MRYLMGALALAPFVLLLVAMVTRRVRVQPCCAPTAPLLSSTDAPGPAERSTPTTVTASRASSTIGHSE